MTVFENNKGPNHDFTSWFASTNYELNSSSSSYFTGEWSFLNKIKIPKKLLNFQQAWKEMHTWASLYPSYSRKLVSHCFDTSILSSVYVLISLEAYVYNVPFSDFPVALKVPSMSCWWWQFLVKKMSTADTKQIHKSGQRIQSAEVNSWCSALQDTMLDVMTFKVLRRKNRT